MGTFTRQTQWQRRFSFLEVLFAFGLLGLVTAATISFVAISNLQVLNGRLRRAADHAIAQEAERWRYAPFSDMKQRGDARESTSESGWLLRRLDDDDTVIGRFPYTLERSFDTVDANTVRVDIELEWRQLVAAQNSDVDDSDPQKLQIHTRTIVRSRY